MAMSGLWRSRLPSLRRGLTVGNFSLAQTPVFCPTIPNHKFARNDCHYSSFPRTSNKVKVPLTRFVIGFILAFYGYANIMTRLGRVERKVDKMQSAEETTNKD